MCKMVLFSHNMIEIDQRCQGTGKECGTTSTLFGTGLSTLYNMFLLWV